MLAACWDVFHYRSIGSRDLLTAKDSRWDRTKTEPEPSRLRRVESPLRAMQPRRVSEMIYHGDVLEPFGLEVRKVVTGTSDGSPAE